MAFRDLFKSNNIPVERPHLYSATIVGQQSTAIDMFKAMLKKPQLHTNYTSHVTDQSPVQPQGATEAEISERYYEKSLFYHNSIKKIATVIAVTGFKVLPREDAPDDILTSAQAKLEKKCLVAFLQNPVISHCEPLVTLVYRSISKLLTHAQMGWEVVRADDSEKWDNYSFKVKLIDGWVCAKHNKFGVLNDLAFEQHFEKEICGFTKDQIIFFMYPNPFRSWQGFTPIALLASQVASELMSQEYNLNFFKNRAVPSGIWLLPQFAVKEEFDAAKQSIGEAYAGVNNAHNSAVVLSGQVDFKPIQSNPEDAQLEKTRNRIREDVGVTMGAPPPVMGYSADGKVSLSEVDNTFLKYNVPFIQMVFAQQISLYLHEVFNYKYYEIVPNKADCVQDAPTLTALTGMVLAGILSSNDVREKIGEPRHPDGEELMLPNNPVGSSTVSEVNAKKPRLDAVPQMKVPPKKKPPSAPAPKVKDTVAVPSKDEIKAALEILSIIKAFKKNESEGVEADANEEMEENTGNIERKIKNEN